MKKIILLAAITIASITAFTACQSSDALIRANVITANSQCPMDMGDNITLTKVDREGDYVVYYYDIDSYDYYFSEDLYDTMKQQIVSDLLAETFKDKSVKLFVDALKKSSVGLIYDYKAPTSSITITIESWEL